VIFLPFVLVYQAWSYYVFRRRISAASFGPPARPPVQPPGHPAPR
jgi:hypothetical protein